MKLKKRKPKSVAWYRRELRSIARMADAALNAKRHRVFRYGTTLAAISASASEAALGRESYEKR